MVQGAPMARKPLAKGCTGRIRDRGVRCLAILAGAEPGIFRIARHEARAGVVGSPATSVVDQF